MITIQKYYRHWLANVNVEALLARKKCLDELRNHKEQGTDLERKKWLEMEYERRLHPRTNQDFDLLFTYLESMSLLLFLSQCYILNLTLKTIKNSKMQPKHTGSPTVEEYLSTYVPKC